jgi:hypothetical protein
LLVSVTGRIVLRISREAASLFFSSASGGDWEGENDPEDHGSNLD